MSCTPNRPAHHACRRSLPFDFTWRWFLRSGVGPLGDSLGFSGSLPCLQKVCLKMFALLWLNCLLLHGVSKRNSEGQEKNYFPPLTGNCSPRGYWKSRCLSLNTPTRVYTHSHCRFKQCSCGGFEGENATAPTWNRPSKCSLAPAFHRGWQRPKQFLSTVTLAWYFLATQPLFFFKNR